MSSHENILISSYEKQLDEIIKELPSSKIYNEFNTINDSTSYTSCSDLGEGYNNFKELCEKFMKNINKLKEYKSNLTELKVRSSSLGYWIIDELWNYFTLHNKDIDRGIIDKLINNLNEISYKSELKTRLFFNSDFDFILSREEKYLHDYFKNYDTIISCTDKCKDYYKYVSYIEKIYYKHREDCLRNVCDYFNFNDKYDPDDLLSILKGRIEGSNKGEDTDSRLGTEGGNPKDSKKNPRMVIKYMLCTEINDEDKQFPRYNCEDPAYRHNSERARFIKNIEKKQETSVIEVRDPLDLTDDSKCTKTLVNGKITRLYCPSKVPLEKLKRVSLSKNNRKFEKLVGKPEKSPVPSTQTVQIVNSNVNIEEHEYPDNYEPGVRFYTLSREVPYFGMESDNPGENGRPMLPTSKAVTLFPEFTDGDRVHYEDKDIPKCEIYTRVRGKLTCKKTIDSNYNEKGASSAYSVNSSGEEEIEEMDEPELYSAPDGFFSILRSSKFRTGTMTFLTFGFTPLGDWLSRKLFKKKKVNNYIYEEPMPKQEGRSSRPPNGSQKSKRIRIAYQSN
ncbi:PIR protein [Plasmodium vivax]|uniref:VIR protein n=1 Tax=Plasmodium vivax TaxID=5855 RepID=A0A565A1D2_PLAVI|nr:PIR protein [Plasmodium vivax]